MESGKARRQHRSLLCMSVLGLLLAACQPTEDPNGMGECKFQNCPRSGGDSRDRGEGTDASDRDGRGGEGCPGC